MSDHKTLVEIYKDGFQAYQDNNANNPYVLLSNMWFAWNRGWATARFGSLFG